MGHRTLLTLSRRLLAPELHEAGFRLFPGELDPDRNNSLFRARRFYR
jgi:hypothetical protein